LAEPELKFNMVQNETGGGGAALTNRQQAEQGILAEQQQAQTWHRQA
jgi:hypothetical protein